MIKEISLASVVLLGSSVFAAGQFGIEVSPIGDRYVAGTYSDNSKLEYAFGITAFRTESSNDRYRTDASANYTEWSNTEYADIIPFFAVRYKVSNSFFALVGLEYSLFDEKTTYNSDATANDNNSIDYSTISLNTGGTIKFGVTENIDVVANAFIRFQSQTVTEQETDNVTEVVTYEAEVKRLILTDVYSLGIRYSF